MEFLRNFFFFLLVFFILFSFFLNLAVSLYSDETNLFKINLRNKKKLLKFNKKKLVFIMKNNNLLILVVCFSQVFINIFLTLLFSKLLDNFRVSTTKRSFSVTFFALFLAMITELLPRYFTYRKRGVSLITNNFFINFTYLLARSFYFFSRNVIKSKKKIFFGSEKNISIFFDNLFYENVLEKEEAALVKSALELDELKISDLFKKKKIVSLHENMSYKELCEIFLRYRFSRYPVFDSKKKRISGILHIKELFFKNISKK